MSFLESNETISDMFREIRGDLSMGTDGPTDIATTDRPTDISDEAHHLGEIIGSIVAVVSGLIALAGAIYKNIEAVRRLLGQISDLYFALAGRFGRAERQQPDQDVELQVMEPRPRNASDEELAAWRLRKRALLARQAQEHHLYSNVATPRRRPSSEYV